MRLIDLTGQRFGRLIVLKRSFSSRKAGHAMWLCRCDCGNTCIKGSYELRQGLVRSCGCLMREWQETSHSTHGMSDSRLYRIWRGMKDRCYRRENVCYAYYGGRGIKVCDEWASSFEVFVKWALQSGYDAALTLDRIDVDGDYCPENCKWATRLDQAQNRRCIRLLTYQGETKPLWEWAEITGVPVSLISGRVSRGWPAERIFTEPVHVNCRNHRGNK